MAKQSGLGDNLYVGPYNLSGDVGSINRVSGGPRALEVTGIDKSAHERIGGQRDGGIDFNTFFNDAALQEHVALSSLPLTDTIVSYFRGTTLGKPVASCVGKQIDYAPTRGQDGSLTVATSVLANGYGIEWGRSLTAGQRTDTTATNGSSIDDTASTAFGAQFYLHVFAFTGTSVTVTIEDSADNSAFATLSGAVFTAATGLTFQRIAVTGTVRRYLRAVTTGTFSNAVFAVNSVRNETAVAF